MSRFSGLFLSDLLHLPTEQVIEHLLARICVLRGRNDCLVIVTTQLCRLMEVKALKPLLRLQGPVEEINSLDFLMLMELPDDSPCFASDNFR